LDSLYLYGKKEIEFALMEYYKAIQAKNLYAKLMLHVGELEGYLTPQWSKKISKAIEWTEDLLNQMNKPAFTLRQVEEKAGREAYLNDVRLIREVLKGAKVGEDGLPKE